MNLSCCLMQGVGASTSLSEGRVFGASEAKWVPFSVSILLVNWELTGTLGASDSRVVGLVGAEMHCKYLDYSWPEPVVTFMSVANLLSSLQDAMVLLSCIMLGR